MIGRPSINRKTSMKVRGGRVQKKNRHIPTTHRGYVLDRESPKKGFRHVVTKRHIQQFIDLIPDWAELSMGLERIILGAGDGQADGWYIYHGRENTGAIRLEAWNANDRIEICREYYEDHKEIFDRFCMSVEPIRKETIPAYFSVVQARAFLLIHVFMHELGHHREKMLAKNGRLHQYSEPFAEKFANDRFEVLWPLYNQRIEQVR